MTTASINEFSVGNFVASAKVSDFAAETPASASQLPVHLVEQVFGSLGLGTVAADNALGQPGPLVSREMSEQGLAVAGGWSADELSLPLGKGQWNDGLMPTQLRSGDNAQVDQFTESWDLQEADLGGLDAFFARESNRQ